MKKLLIVIITVLLCSCSSLPKPQTASGIRGAQLGIDKNINEATIDKYLGREDAVYRDMRMLIDEANYEAIGGSSILTGYVEGFEVVPFPLLCNVTGLPEEVGNTYQGITLFYFDGEEYLPNFKESMEILESLFPKDKVIFLMCGGGGYAGMMKNMLIALGYNKNKIYNVGGFWYYDGDHAIMSNDDFSNVIYHDISFEGLSLYYR